MNKSESKYFNTAILMDKALLELLEFKDLEYISVKEICAKAGVNRSTFYLHYETIGDLLAESLEYINKQFLDSFSKGPGSFISNIDTVSLDELVLINSGTLRPYLNFVKQNKSIFKAAFKNPSCMQTDKKYRDISEFILSPILKRFQVPEKEHSYWITFYINGSMAIINQWINGNFKDSVEEIETILLHCIRPEHGLEGSTYKE